MFPRRLSWRVGACWVWLLMEVFLTANGEEVEGPKRGKAFGTLQLEVMERVALATTEAVRAETVLLKTGNGNISVVVVMVVVIVLLLLLTVLSSGPTRSEEWKEEQ